MTKMRDSQAVNFKDFMAGSILIIRLRRYLASNTTVRCQYLEINLKKNWNQSMTTLSRITPSLWLITSISVVTFLLTDIKTMIHAADANDTLMIAKIADQATDEDIPLVGVPFAVKRQGKPFDQSDWVTVTVTSNNPSLIPDNNINAQLSDGADGEKLGKLTLTPAPNQNGTAILTLAISDGVNRAQVSFTFTVKAVNDPPVIVPIADQTTQEDTPFPAISFIVDEGGGGDEDVQILTVTVSSFASSLFSEAGIKLQFDDDETDATGGTITLTPNPNTNGSTHINVTVSDGVITSELTFAVTVIAVDDPPRFSPLNDQTILEDTVLSEIAFTVDEGGAEDENEQLLTVTVTSSNTTLVPDQQIKVNFSDTDANAAGGLLSITPAPNQNGMTTITLTADDGMNIAQQSFILKVTSVDDPPVISTIPNQFTNEDTPIKGISFTADEGGGSDEDQQILTATVASSNPELVPPENISLHFLDDTADAKGGTLDIFPAENKFGTTTITVIISDGAASAETRFLLTVTSVNDFPTLSQILDQQTKEDVPILGIPFTADEGGGDEENSEILTIRVSSSNTTLVPDQNITLYFKDDSNDAMGGKIDVLPAPGQNGSTIITLTVDDGSGSAQESFTLTVLPINNVPIIIPIADQHSPEDKPINALYFEVDEGGGSDEDIQILTVKSVSSNEELIPTGNIIIDFTDSETDAVGGTLTIVPAPNQAGVATITMSVNDGNSSSLYSFTVTIEPVNDPPEIMPIPPQTIPEDGLLENITITADEGGGKNEDAQILVLTATTSQPNLIPTANIKIDFNDTITDASTGVLALRPAPNQNGTAIITIIANDGDATSQQTMEVTIAPVDDPPQIAKIPDQTGNEDMVLSSIAFIVDEGGASDEDVQIVTIKVSSSNQALIPDGNITINFNDSTGDATGGSLRIQPASQQNGNAFITLTVSDGHQEVQETFQVLIKAVNDPPILSDLADLSGDEDEALEPLDFKYSPGGGDDEAKQEVTIKAASANQALIPDKNLHIRFAADAPGSGVLQIAPNPNENGSAKITLTISDGSLTVNKSFTVSVAAQNDPPLLSPISDQTTNEDQPISAIAFTADEGGGSDEDSQILVLTAESSNTELVPSENIAINFQDDGKDATGGTISIFPRADHSGSSVITVTADDGNSQVSQSFRLQVNAVNDPPVLSVIDNLTVSEDGAITGIPFTVDEGGSSDENDQVLALTASSSNPSLIPIVGITLHFKEGSREPHTGSIDIIPATDQNGVAAITLTVSDGLASSKMVFNVNVIADNDAPVIAGLKDLTIREDTLLEGVAFTVDEGGGSDEDHQIVTLSVSSSNTALVTDDNIHIKFSDQTGDAERGILDLIPNRDRNGVTTITITANDGAKSTQQQFLLTVTPVNDAPIWSAIDDQTIREDGIINNLAFTVDEGGGDDEDRQILRLAAASSNQALIPDQNIRMEFVDDERDAGSGLVTIRPAPNAYGKALITLTADDGASTSVITFNVMVQPVDDAPIAVSEEIKLEEDQVYTNGQLSGDDWDGDTLTYILSIPPEHGKVTNLNPDKGTYEYHPDTDYNGLDRFSFKVNDGISDSNIATIAIEILPVEDHPTIIPIADQSTDEDHPLLGVKLNVDEGGGSDEDTQILQIYAETSNPGLIPVEQIHINFSDGINDARPGSLDLYPAPNRSGVAKITITVDDGKNKISSSFMITVNPVNDLPTISVIANQNTDENGKVENIPFEVDEGGGEDEDQQHLTITVASSNQNLVAVSNINIHFEDGDGDATGGTIDIFPAINEYGTATITITVSDGAATASRSFLVTKLLPTGNK